ncbi:autophagy-related protein 16-like isoform X3 [Hemicordylus capensis]|uniref:autophagy-related protein 16-like isoform X3 n=1 Tax=Hemicordylus capensis TaxID=884348 RepID=UPI002303C69A|nr:autophagy-related protein 16-like isoform X3 [Hemicordylus capensis]
MPGSPCGEAGHMSGRGMQRVGWRQHVRAELERRERSGRGLRGLLERHEKLQDRLETQQTLLAEKLLQAGEASGPPLDLASLRVQHEMEAAELRREREELRQQVALFTNMLRETEAENQEQRARAGRLSQASAALRHQYEELQCKAWLLSREAEGLRRELERAQALLQGARQERLQLEARWVREKALEAQRLNCANEREERYRQKVACLREKLRRARGPSASLVFKPGAESAISDGGSFGTSCEEAETPEHAEPMEEASPTECFIPGEKGGDSTPAGSCSS